MRALEARGPRGTRGCGNGRSATASFVVDGAQRMRDVGDDGLGFAVFQKLRLRLEERGRALFVSATLGRNGGGKGQKSRIDRAELKRHYPSVGYVCIDELQIRPRLALLRCF
jgi:hypothetical protein